MDSRSLPAHVRCDLPLESLPLEPMLTREFDRRPDLVYERLRRRYGQVAPVDLAGVPVWLVLGYDEVRGVLQDGDLWRRETRFWRAKAEGRLPADWPIVAGYELRHMMFVDGDEHRALRRTFDAALRPFQDPESFQARRLRSDIHQYADELIAEFATGNQTGWADLCVQYARPLALMVLNRLYGFPAEKAEDVMMDVWRVIDGSADAPQAVQRVLEAMTALAVARRAEPRDDLISRMIAADPTLTPERLASELFMIAVYLSDGTSNMISNTLVELLDGNAGARASLSLGLIGETVDRAAVANPPVANLTFRFPARDTRLGHFLLAAGDAVIPSVAAAHADMFARGAAGATVVSTRAHLAWGAGQHGCPRGARELGTTIVTTAVERLTHGFAHVELAVPADQLSWRSAHIIRGLRTLPVRFEPHEDLPKSDTETALEAGSARQAAATGAAGTADAPAPEAERPSRWRRFLTRRAIGA